MTMTAAIQHNRRLIRPSRILLHLFLLITSLMTAMPLLWAVLTSFKPANEILSVTPHILPMTWTLDNYAKLGTTFPLMRFMTNSIIVSAVSTLFIALGCTTAGYVFAKYQFRGKN